jgi:hypothetical protein
VASDPETVKQRASEIPSLREKLELALFCCLKIVLTPSDLELPLIV